MASLHAIRLLRSAQTFFPVLRNLKFDLYNFSTRHFGWRIPEEFAILDRLGPVGLALDIGGNRGQSILAFQRCCKPRQIISFEPNQHLSGRLEARMRGYQAVEIRHHALGEQSGAFDLYVPRYRKFVFDGLASLDRDAAHDWLNADRMVPFDPRHLTIERQKVEVMKLDELDLAPDVVKIDVQGAEEQVVRGGYRTFARFRPLTIIEAPTERLVALMREFGLDAYRCDRMRLSSNYRGKSDVMFLTQAHREKLDCARAPMQNGSTAFLQPRNKENPAP